MAQAATQPPRWLKASQSQRSIPEAKKKPPILGACPEASALVGGIGGSSIVGLLCPRRSPGVAGLAAAERSSARTATAWRDIAQAGASQRVPSP